MGNQMWMSHALSNISNSILLSQPGAMGNKTVAEKNNKTKKKTQELLKW